jgi:hypothetical protein
MLDLDYNSIQAQFLSAVYSLIFSKKSELEIFLFAFFGVTLSPISQGNIIHFNKRTS